MVPCEIRPANMHRPLITNARALTLLVVAVTAAVGAERGTSLSSSATTPAQVDGEAAEPREPRSDVVPMRVAQAAEEKNLDRRLQQLEKLAAGLAVGEIASALDCVGSLRELRERVVLQRAVLMRWCELEPEPAFSHIAALPESQLKVNTLREAAARFARANPAGAADAAVSLPSSVSRNDAITAIADAWAHIDASAAFAWTEKILPRRLREEAQFAIGYAWAHADPIAASANIEKLRPSETRNNILAQVAYGWAVRDPQAALKWAATLQDWDRRAAIVNIAEAWANDNPEAAGEFVQNLAADETRTSAAALVAARWAKQDPRAAGEWAWNRPDMETRRRALEGVLHLWVEVHPAECARWLERLSSGADRDYAVRTFISAAGGIAPDVAVRAALWIQDETLRVEAANEALSRWVNVDPHAALNWVLDSALPEPVKMEWLQNVSTEAGVPQPVPGP
jgi:hypothetical protein